MAGPPGPLSSTEDIQRESSGLLTALRRTLEETPRTHSSSSSEDAGTASTLGSLPVPRAGPGVLREPWYCLQQTSMESFLI